MSPAAGESQAAGALHADEPLEDETFENGAYEGEALAHERAHEEPYQIDPLDAQNAGLHDQELALGHEEIHLNLDDVETGPHAAEPPPAPARHE